VMWDTRKRQKKAKKNNRGERGYNIDEEEQSPKELKLERGRSQKGKPRWKPEPKGNYTPLGKNPGGVTLG